MYTMYNILYIIYCIQYIVYGQTKVINNFYILMQIYKKEFNSE
jgi:hypothetical protein